MLLKGATNIKIKNVTSSNELFQIFRLRYEKLVRENKRIKADQVYDEKDAISYIFFAYDATNRKEPLGSIRLTDEDDIRAISMGQSCISIVNCDIEPHKNCAKNVLVGRLVASSTQYDLKVLPGLFCCMWEYHKCCKSDYNIFIVANCEIKPGVVEIPDIYRFMHFVQIGEIKKKYYDEFDINSAPMVSSISKISPVFRRWLTPMSNIIELTPLSIDERKYIYEMAVNQYAEADSL